jgi:hypothetical protein
MKIKAEWIETAGRRSREHDWALGSLLGKYCRLERKAPDALADDLGCSPDTFNRLLLCRRPESDDLGLYVAVLSERFAFDQERLIAVLRHALVVIAMHSDGETEVEQPTLMAARDRRRVPDGDR